MDLKYFSPQNVFYYPTVFGRALPSNITHLTLNRTKKMKGLQLGGDDDSGLSDIDQVCDSTSVPLIALWI